MLLRENEISFIFISINKSTEDLLKDNILRKYHSHYFYHVEILILVIVSVRNQDTIHPQI